MATLTTAQRRYLALVEQLAVEYERKRGWQRRSAERLGISPSHLQQIVTGGKQPGIEIIERAQTRLRLRSEFFLDPKLRAPEYTDYILGVEAPDRAPDPTWTSLEEDGTVRWYSSEGGLTEAHLQAIQDAMPLEHAQREDYIALLEAVVGVKKRGDARAKPDDD